MSYTELESGYQGLKHNRPGFYVGEDGNLIALDRGDLELDPSDGIDSDGSVSSNSGKQVIVGICAMSKKSQSKPMKEILTRLQDFEFIKIIIFPEETILKEAVEQWPTCDCLISFHSKGFPLDKAIQYAQLRKPYVINNLHMQYDIQDRRKVYSILEGEGIEIPRYAVLDRDSPDPKQHELVESEDHVEVNGVIFNKPFVEKPVSAEDHNIYIYYPTSAGGGSQRLFRKIGSRSSVYSPESRVRKTGSFIYEDFMPTDGTDVKVYTVGPDYAHAEARKSPALDGKVERDSEGKEIRYPVILSNAEKLISRKVCLAFKQTVCGFDLLRANGKSYVCDVNGFSFVKNSNKYYDDCAKILGNMILRELAPTLHIPWSVPFQLDDPPIVPTTFGKMMELRCVVAIIRHGDRTPKQKMKVEVRHPKFFEIFEKYDGYKHGHIKLKRPKQLQEILDVARSLLSDIQTKAADPEIEEKQGKLEQLKSVLEMYGHFSGINRKVQMKYQPKGRPRGSSSDDGNISSNGPKDPSLVLILKWGGELTPAGRIQAEELGRIFRCMYPGGQGRNEYSGTQGLGLLRLHSTFRHDLKIYASDEGRVQMTAAAFAKGLLALEGELTPILVQMVKSANTNGLLDNDCDSSKYQNIAKNRLHELMQIDRDFTPQDRDAINPGNSISINQAMDFVKNPVKCCNHVQALIQSLLAVVVVKRDDQKTRDTILYHGETWELMGRRWGKIEKDFSTKSKTYDISKIPDIYDCIKYDLQHNQHTLQFEQAEELYKYAKYLADIVIPQEYGLTIQEKLTIGQGICTPLLKKIKADLQRNIEEVGDESVNRLNPRYSHGVSSPGRHVRTRLYFTSESHVHSLLTVLRYGGLADILNDEQWRRAMEYVSMVSELNYMSQIVIMLYEDPTKDPSSEERFHVELHFSPGVNCCVQKNLPPGPGFRPHSRNDSGASKNASGEEDGPSTRIDEEGEMMFEEDFGPIQTVTQKSDSAKSPNDDLSPSEFSSTKNNKKSKHLKTSNPITIGSHHTVSGHEAMDLAKRLTEELAAQQSTNSLGSNRAISPDSEPRARSFEHRHHHHHHHAGHHHDKVKDDNSPHSSLMDLLGGGVSKPYQKPKLHHETVSATNELPLSEIHFHVINPESPIVYDSLDISLIAINDRPLISPLATNERPLSSTCLANEPDLTVVQFLSILTAPDEDYNSFVKRSRIVHASNRNHIGSKSLFNCVTQDDIVRDVDVRQVASAPASLSCSPRQSIIIIDDNDNNQIEIDKIDDDSHILNSNTTENVSESNIINVTTTTNAITVQQTTTNITDTIINTDHSTLTITAPSTTLSSILCTKLNNPTILHHQKMVKLNNTDSPASATTHHNNNSSSSSTSSSAVRRQRHSIAGQMNYFKLLGFGGFNKKMTTSTNSLFSTAVISGSSSAPNLRDMIPNTITSPSVLEGFGGVPPIRPLETLHNALSLKQIDTFLEKMTNAMLFKTPASSPPKNPSTPIPTPLQTPQNSLPHASMLRSSWSEQSSMTNSTSALSSGGPSSPNISDMYSRGCPSSDMSASLISNDGVGVYGATPELSHMFPALDYDLSSVGAQLTLDQIENRSLTDFKMETRFGHESGDTTPVSASSDWEFNTNDATKGSTTNELCMEEEEEETTLSTDTCLSTQGDLLSSSMDQIDFMNNDNTMENNFSKLSNKSMFQPFQPVTSIASDTAPKTITDYDFIKSNLKNDLFLVTPQPSTSASASLSTSPITGTPKIDNKYRNNRIQKQISLYEKESICTTEYKNLAKDVPKFNETPSNIKLAKRRIGTVEPPNFLSAEDLEKSMTNIEKNLNSATLENQKDKCTKTKSCVNLKLVANPSNIQTASMLSCNQIASTSGYSNNPGAVLVRESFIEPPRRVAKSFHGKTQYSNLDSKRRSNEIPEGTATDLILKKTNNILSRQYSIPGTSSGYTTGTSGSANNNCNSAASNTSRFRTRLVREISEPAPFMEDFLLEPNNINNSSSATDNGSSVLLPESSAAIVIDQLNRPKNVEDNN